MENGEVSISCVYYKTMTLYQLKQNTSEILVVALKLSRALCRIKLLPVTHVLVDTWMLTVNAVYKLSNVSDDLKWTTNTRDTIFTHLQGIINNIYGFGRPCFYFPPSFFYLLTTHPPYFYPSIFVFTRPNDGWMGLYIKL